MAFGDYAGGVEGASSVSWFRQASIPGRAAAAEEKMESGVDGEGAFDACVDDVGYALVAMYTPVRSDGAVGEPARAESQVRESLGDAEGSLGDS